jgi:hypothetical protein
MFFSGYFQKWPQQWDAETQRGISAASLVDSWNYVNGNLQPILLQEILNDNPYSYWPLTDAQGVTQGSNRAPGNNIPMTSTLSKYGSRGAVAQFGQNSDALLGAQGTLIVTQSVRLQAQSGMWQQTLPSTSVGQSGVYLTATDSNFPVSSGGVTVELWFQITTPLQTNTVVPLYWANNTRTSGIILEVSTAGDLKVFQQLNGTTADLGTVGGGFNYNTINALTHVAITFNTTAFTVYINGVSQMTGTFSPVLKHLTALNCCAFQGDQWFFAGYVAHVAVFGYLLAPGRIYTHYVAGVQAMTGDTDYGRIERLIQAGGYQGRRVILQSDEVIQPDSTTTVVSCQDISGQPAATSVQNIVTSTAPSAMVVAPTGDVFYLQRMWAFNEPVRWVLGDEPWLGEIPYDPDDFMVDYDPTRVINDVQLSQLDNQDIVLPTVNQLPSQQQYGDLTWWQTGYLEGDVLQPLTFGPGLQDLANWVFETNSRPFLRPSTVTIDASANPWAWSLVLGVAPGDMITLTRRPPTLSATASTSAVIFTFTGRVSQVQRALTFNDSQTAAKVTLTIDPAPEQNVLTVGDATRGVLNGTNVLGW